MRLTSRLLPPFLAVPLLVGCQGVIDGVTENPRSAKDEINYNAGGGKLFGDISLDSIMGEKNTGDALGLAVNATLWQSTLDIISFLPLSSADPFTGIIITDWYSSPGYPEERYKLNVRLIGKELRSDAVKVAIFKERREATGGWISVDADPKSARKLEDSILNRAREIRSNSAANK